MLTPFAILYPQTIALKYWRHAPFLRGFWKGFYAYAQPNPKDFLVLLVSSADFSLPGNSFPGTMADKLLSARDIEGVREGHCT